MSIITNISESFSPPGTYVSITLEGSSSANSSFRVLIMGNAETGSTLESNGDLYPITTLSQLASDFGKTSDIYQIAAAYRVLDTTTSLYAINCVPPVQNSETISNGNILQFAATLNTAASDTDMAGTNVSGTGGSGTGATFDITSTQTGSTYVPASIKINQEGTGYKVNDKITIPNVGYVIVTQTDTQTVIPDPTTTQILEAAFANIGDVSFDMLISNFNSPDGLQAFDNYLAGTWSYSTATYGTHFTVLQDTVQNMVALAPSLNYSSSVVVATPETLDTNQVLGSYTSQIALRTQTNPSLPLRSFTMDIGVVPSADRFNVSTRNTLFNAGFSTIVCDTAGVPTLERTRLMATTDSEGETLGDVTLETRFQAVYIAKGLVSYLNPLYITTPRIVVPDGTSISNVYAVSPSAIKGSCIAYYTDLINDLICVDIDTFTSSVSVEQDTTTPGRMNVYFPATLASGLNQIAINLVTTK